MTEDTSRLVVLIAEKSHSNGTRPRMADDVEARLDDLERRSASCYAELELATHRAGRLAEAIDDEDEDEDDGPGEPDEEDSLVARIEELRGKTGPPNGI